MTVGEAFRASASEVGPKRGLIEVGWKKGVFCASGGASSRGTTGQRAERRDVRADGEKCRTKVFGGSEGEDVKVGRGKRGERERVEGAATTSTKLRAGTRGGAGRECSRRIGEERREAKGGVRRG